MNKFIKLVLSKLRELNGTDYSLGLYQYSSSMLGIQFYYLGSLLCNLMVYKDTLYIGKQFINDLDKYMDYKLGNKNEY